MSANPAARQEQEQRERHALLPLACFSQEHQARPVPEEPDPYRTCFVRDRDRVLHCGALRRLKDKTQVFVIDEGDFYRTRLTHTLEVTQMARFLAGALRLNETLAEVLALVHDIGHPPFGHEGERVLDQHSEVDFDHNSQALRIVDVLESPYHDRPGLNLTHSVRRSILKHGGDAGRDAPEWQGALLEAQIADLADSTAYQHHDLEDALRAGLLDEAELSGELGIWREAAQLVPAGLAPPLHIKAVLNAIVKASLQDIVAVSAAALDGLNQTDAVSIARQDLRPIRLSPRRAGLHRELGRFLHARFYQHDRVTRSRAIADEAIAVIVDHFLGHPDELPAPYRARIDESGLPRTVCDYVAGMTDRFATEQWRRLSSRRMVVAAATWEPLHVPDEPLQEDQRLRRVEQAVGHHFGDNNLLTMALTHSSARTDQKAPNQRLEFLGDAVLGLVIGGHLYGRFPEREEGELSRIKSATVSRHALRRIAELWNLGPCLELGAGLAADGNLPPSIAADAVEAVLGALFLDAGLAPASAIILRDFGPILEKAADAQRSRNDKSDLQQWTQGELGYTPYYQVVAEEGPDHAKVFTVTVVVNNVTVGRSSGRNKRQAEQRAAREALTLLRAAAFGAKPFPKGLGDDRVSA